VATLPFLFVTGVPVMRLKFALAAAALVVVPSFASAQDLVRIEPRPFYGATVTLENGVRVYRALPSHSRIIINPSNAPVSLNFNDTRAYSESYNSNESRSYNYNDYGYGYR
jgi:hypothetical protein